MTHLSCFLMHTAHSSLLVGQYFPENALLAWMGLISRWDEVQHSSSQLLMNMVQSSCETGFMWISMHAYAAWTKKMKNKLCVSCTYPEFIKSGRKQVWARWPTICAASTHNCTGGYPANAAYGCAQRKSDQVRKTEHSHGIEVGGSYSLFLCARTFALWFVAMSPHAQCKRLLTDENRYPFRAYCDESRHCLFIMRVCALHEHKSVYLL